MICVLYRCAEKGEEKQKQRRSRSDHCIEASPQTNLCLKFSLRFMTCTVGYLMYIKRHTLYAEGVTNQAVGGDDRLINLFSTPNDGKAIHNLGELSL